MESSLPLYGQSAQNLTYALSRSKAAKASVKGQSQQNHGQRHTLKNFKVKPPSRLEVQVQPVRETHIVKAINIKVKCNNI